MLPVELALLLTPLLALLQLLLLPERVAAPLEQELLLLLAVGSLDHVELGLSLAALLLLALALPLLLLLSLPPHLPPLLEELPEALGRELTLALLAPLMLP